MNKGFTLVELLAVLFLLSIITLLTVPNIIKTNEKTRQNEINEFKKTIENAAEIYVETHQNNEEIILLKSNNGYTICVSTNKLINQGLINKGITNPESGETFADSTGSVNIRNESGEIKYAYQNTDCQ